MLTPALLQKVYGNFSHKLKLIVLVREPISRAWSDYKYFCSKHAHKTKHLQTTAGAKHTNSSDPRLFHDAVVALIAKYKQCFKDRTELECVLDKNLQKDGKTGRMGIGIYEPLYKVVVPFSFVLVLRSFMRLLPLFSRLVSLRIVLTAAYLTFVDCTARCSPAFAFVSTFARMLWHVP